MSNAISLITLALAKRFTKKAIAEASSEIGFKTQIVDTLPAVGDAHTIYLIPKEDEEDSNSYQEYLYINDSWESVGSTSIKLPEGNPGEFLQYNDNGELVWKKLDTLEVQGDITINANTENQYTINTLKESVETFAENTYESIEKINDVLDTGLILTAPNGSKYKLGVTNDGHLTTSDAEERPSSRLGRFILGLSRLGENL